MYLDLAVPTTARIVSCYILNFNFFFENRLIGPPSSGPAADSCLTVFRDRAALVPHSGFRLGLGSWNPDVGSLVLTAAALIPSNANTTITFLVSGSVQL